MLEAIGSGLAALLTPQAILFMFIGVVYGLVIGILPGLGGVVAMALLLPFTYGFEKAATLALLLGAHIATIWGDSVTSILFSVPGSAKGLALCFDGYPMTKQGQATRALSASATGALMGGVIGAIFLALCIPLIRPVILALGPSEYLMMALWGLTVIATFSEGSLMKGLIASLLGVLVAFVGMDVVTATPRFTFGSEFLMDGISFPVAMIGLFAVSEMMKLAIKGTPIVDRSLVKEVSSVWQGITDAFHDAERCATALDQVFSGARAFDEALGDYQRARDEHVLPMYEFTCQLATLEPPPPEMQQLFAAIHGNKQAMDAFVQMNAGTISPAQFFAPENIGAMMRASAV